MPRPTYAYVDLSAFRDNYKYAKTLSHTKVLAVMKADAYGHGLVRCASVISDISDGYAVAFTEEAIILRDAQIHNTIVVLEGPFDEADILAAINHRLILAIRNIEQIHMLKRTRLHSPLHVWLLIDSGMHRAGFMPHQTPYAYKALLDIPHIQVPVIMTHLAQADETDPAYTQYQLAIFQDATHNLPGSRSICNSAGLLAWNATTADQWMRAGIMLYGVDPTTMHSPNLHPVMSLQSTIIDIKEVNSGQYVGYGTHYKTERPTRIGLIAIGYGDGYPRHLHSTCHVLVNGCLAPIIGHVSMDMITVDLTDIRNAKLGSSVELWGKNLSVSLVANNAQTIPYDLLCGVKRVERIYSSVTAHLG